MNKKLFEYIKNSPTAFHACDTTAKTLVENGYTELLEGEKWTLNEGQGYFVRRNGSSLIAFRVPKGEISSLMITASHCDSPCLKIKENFEIADSHYVKLSTEIYGGPIYASWLDKPLAIAGRVVIKGENGIEIKLVDTRSPLAIIPNVAIHMNRQVNSGMNYNAAVDMLPLYSQAEGKGTLISHVASLAGVSEEQILTHDLFVYNMQECVEWGDFISAPRLDDLMCAFSCLSAFIDAKGDGSMPIYALFDNEEVGSQTKQGAASTFMSDVIERIAEGCGMSVSNRVRLISNSLMLSCDNAHAVHPNHPEYADRNHSVYMNGGIVIKYNANQKYTSDAVSAGMFKLICESAGVPTQNYANRADMPGGSTLGNISNTQVSINTVDIGLAQLAMHSSYETAGARDTEYMVKAITEFYSKRIKSTEHGYGIV